MSKYHNRKTEVDGYLFDSMAEARRYKELKLLELSGRIRSLELQPRYPLVINKSDVGTYIGDFLYLDCETGQKVLEDVKGIRTTVYRLKKRLIKAIYGIDIVEVSA
jgi:hypothetical protein